MKSFFLILNASLFLVACSGSSNSSDKQENLSYDLTYNDCPTGKQSFPSKEALCAGLKDHKLNDNCAETSRRELFKQSGCPGQFDNYSAVPSSPGPQSSPNPTPNSTMESHPTRTNESTQPAPAPLETPLPVPTLTDPQGENQIVVRTNEFLSGNPWDHCSNILCLVQKLSGNTQVVSDPENSSIHIQKFSHNFGPSVNLECVRRYDIRHGHGLGKGKCQLLVDLALSTEQISIQILNTDPKTVLIEIAKKAIFDDIKDATQNLMMSSTLEEVPVRTEDGQLQDKYRIQLGCGKKDGEPPRCLIRGIVN